MSPETAFGRITCIAFRLGYRSAGSCSAASWSSPRLLAAIAHHHIHDFRFSSPCAGVPRRRRPASAACAASLRPICNIRDQLPHTPKAIFAGDHAQLLAEGYCATESLPHSMANGLACPSRLLIQIVSCFSIFLMCVPCQWLRAFPFGCVLARCAGWGFLNQLFGGNPNESRVPHYLVQGTGHLGRRF